METIHTDVLIIGAGAAGIRAALAASELGAEVLMIAKSNITQSGSTFSDISNGWGMQALVEKEQTDENLEAFYNDIMHVSLGCTYPKLVRILVEASGSRLMDLIAYGVRFKKNSDGNYIRAKGCFSKYKRAFLTDNMQNIKKSFRSALQTSPVIITTGYVIELISIDNKCWGAWAVTHPHDIVKLKAKATILATGGGAGIFKDHLVSDEQLGDGYALAHKAGAQIENIEFIQFMLGLKNDRMRRFLPLSDLGNPCMMQDYDGRNLLEKYILHKKEREKAVTERRCHFPFSCRDTSYLIDIAVANERRLGKKVFWGNTKKKKESIEVVHFSHAFNGGVKINEFAESTVSGLFAAGEAAAGPHGADRIGGCMMTATQVFGERAGRFASIYAKKIKHIPETPKRPGVLQNRKEQSSNMDFINEMKETARKLFSQNLTILRDEIRLSRCLEYIKDQQQELDRADWCKPHDLKAYIDLHTIMQAGRLISESALKRTQSLGPHFRLNLS